MTSETTRTDRHEFRIFPCRRYGHDGEGYEVEFRPLNPKTGEPWQASRRVTDGADIEPGAGWSGRPIAYSTPELARAARDRQIAKLARRR